MRHRKYTFKIGRTSEHRKALLANQVSSLINVGEIRTTVEKAKETRRLAEKMVTHAKKADLHHRRLAISKIRDRGAVAKLFSEIAPKYAERNGGYTRIVKLGTRIGDSAEMCILQWVGEELIQKKKKAKASKSSKKKVDEKKGETAKTSVEEPKKEEGAPVVKAPKEENK